MNKKIDHVIGLCMLSALLAVNVAMAQTPGTTGNALGGVANTISAGNVVTPYNANELNVPNPSLDSAVMEKDPGYIERQSKLATVISNGVGIINIRVNDLNKLKKLVNASNLNAEQKSSLVSLIESEIGQLQALAAKIKADTDIRTAKADSKSVYTTFRTYGVFIPKIKMTMAMEQLEAHYFKLLNSMDPTDLRIHQDSEKCLNVSVRQKALEDAIILSDNTLVPFDDARTSVYSLNPENYSEGSKTVISNVNKTIRDVRLKLNTMRMLINRANSRSYNVCARNQVCTAGNCVAKPPCNNQCSLGQMGCGAATGLTSAATWYCTKDSAGCFIKKESTCSTGKVCSSGRCIAPPVTPVNPGSQNQCVIGTTGCNSTTASWLCVNSNYGYTTKQEVKCAAGQSCLSGKCAPTPGTE